jgi:hypothetical protein
MEQLLAENECELKEWIERGWRQCAVGQKTTQWCAEAERVRGELREQRQRDEALLRQVLAALECSDWYMGQLEWIVYSPDDTGTHEERAKVQSAIAALRERLRRWPRSQEADE